MAGDEETSKGGGPARANAIIDRLYPAMETTSVSFARIIIGLFPEWFDFGENKFSILKLGQRGLLLIASGETRAWFEITTSDCRGMICCLTGETNDYARIDMHYQPSPEQLDRARFVIGLAAHALFPERGPAPLPDGAVILPGRVFPTGWRGEWPEFVTNPGATTGGTRKRWWRPWQTNS